MDRLTKLEIQRALLEGRELAWKSANGKREAIQLENANQRRLFEYLLSSPVRDSKGLSDNFVDELSKAYAAENDPATETRATDSSVASGPWRLRRIETEGFGGLNTCNGPPFSYDFDGQSLIVQGPNGSGKSSLVGAILWALTGERPREHDSERAENRAEVYDETDSKIGTWPPIACYPDKASDLSGNPIVRVTLTFANDAGLTAIAERCLKDGKIISNYDPAMVLPDVLIETGLLMPSRLPQIRFEKGQTPLTRAVQSLTGLDDLVDIGVLVDGLCHRGREYLSTNEKQFQQHKVLFESALGEAQRSIKPTGETIDAFQPKDTSDGTGAFAQLGKRLRLRAAELTQVIGKDLVIGLDLTNASVQMEVAGAISIALDGVTAGLEALPTWKTLSALGSALEHGVIERLQRTADDADAALAEAIALNQRAQNDTRLQLKALGAHWHEANKGAAELTDCPLCDQPIDNPALKTQLESLRRAGAATTRQFNDNINAIQAELIAAVPPVAASKLNEIASLAPRHSLIADLEAALIGKPRVKNALATFVQLTQDALRSAPEAELSLSVKAESGGEAIDQVRTRIAAVRRLLLLNEWRVDNGAAWKEWWRQISGTEIDLSPSEGDEGEETLTQHLARLSDAIGEAEPYRTAADALGRAWKSGRDAHRYKTIQEEREAITKALTPLKSLGTIAEAQARLSIDVLSDEISSILKRMHLSDQFKFKGARLQRRSGLQVHGGFGAGFKIDATLVANTSWLRAVLWAFIFALRNEAVKQIGTDALPLLVFDDPQATFDAEHRHRWACEIVRLQAAPAPVQILLATFDEIFVELVKIDGVKAREAVIVSPGSEIGRLSIFEGASLDRKWAKTETENTPSAARDYIAFVRTYVEGLLRLMLRGHAADVSSIVSGFVMGEARNKIHELNTAMLAPWDKPEFKRLVGQLDVGIPAIKYIEMAHHSSQLNLGMGEALTVEEHWRKNLSPALRRAFQIARDHQLIHGGLRALHANEPSCTLPEGYSSKVKSLRFHLLGRAAALTDGQAADGRVDLDFSVTGSRPIVLGRHFAFRLLAPTLEPVARIGDILLVREMNEPSPKSLVVARCEDRVLARRFEIADNHSDIAVLTAHAINPRRIAQPIVVKKSTLHLHKIIGVLFDHNVCQSSGEGEVSDCGGESVLHHYVVEVKGLVEVAGQSAEPLALDGQMLMIGEQISPDDALTRFEGRPVIAGDRDDNRYFKRLRRGRANTVVLESLEISGEIPPIVLTHQTGQSTDITQVWPVHGVLFERP